MQKLILYLQVHLRNLILRRLTQSKSDQGASILEYAAVIVLVAGIAIALLQLEVFDNLVTSLETRVQEVLDTME